MQVLMFSRPEGGIAQYSYCLCGALQKLPDVNVTSLLHDEPEYDLSQFAHSFRVARTLVKPHTRLERVTTAFKNLMTLRNQARQNNVVHFQWSSGPSRDRLNWGMLRQMHKPVVFTAHDAVPHEQMKAELEHSIWLARNADAVIVHGEEQKTIVVKNSGISEARVHVIPHGNFNPIVDHYEIVDRDQARSSFGFDNKDFVILFFGHVRKYKGLDTLLDACSALCIADPRSNIRLLIAGPPVANSWEQGNYTEKIAADGLTERTTAVIEYIRMEDVGKFFTACDAVALPYITGSQSGVIQLAYSYAKPVVVTNVGSFSEVVEDGQTGFVVEPNNPVAFASALQKLDGDCHAAQRMGRAGRDYSENALSWDSIARKTVDVYDSVLGE